MSPTAIPPRTDLAAAFLTMLDDFDAHDPHNAAFYAPARQNFEAYVRSLQDEEAGRDLPPGYVPCTHRWLVAEDGAIVGVTRLRHRIDTDFLAHNGGHIGYDVAPSHRGRGYGHLAMSVALAEARGIGLDRVLLYAAEDNAPSRATIERAGGVLEQVAYSSFWKERLCRYWVAVPS